MRTKLLIALLFVSGISAAQSGYVPRNVKEAVIATAASGTTTVPAGAAPTLNNGWPRSGALYVDSVGGGLGFHYYLGGTWRRLVDSSEVAGFGIYANGITNSGDTAILGDSLNRATFIYVQSRLQNYARFNGLQLTNDSTAQDPYPYFLTYNPSPFGIKRVYRTSLGDIDSAFYGGNISTLFQLFRDSTDALFGAGMRNELLPGMGGEFVGQYYPPRDTTVLKVGRDGQSGNLLYGQFDLGNSFGYNLNVVPPTTMPSFPISVARTSIDLSRVIDNTRRKKMTGAGVSGYTSMYKSYQSTINTSTYETGSYTDSIFGFKAYGDAYPFISQATKAKTLAVWTVKNAFGMYIDPQYRYTNTTDNGYSLYAAGDSDILVNRGFAYFGPSASPQRQNNTEGLRYRMYLTGKAKFTDSLLSTGIIDGYGLSVRYPASIGSQPALTFALTDSFQSAAIFLNSPANRDQRNLTLRIEGFGAADYPDDRLGMYIRFETGVNHANVSRISRNGNWTLGNSAAALAYRWYKKHTVDGGGVYRDTLKLEVAPLQVADDTTNYKPVVRHITTGDLLTMPWVGGSGGGGGGGGITIGTTTITSGSNTNILYNNSGVVGEYTLTGTGTAVAMGASPVFTTDITSPIVQGGSSSGGTLTLRSTTNATKGKILFGTSAYDEVNNRLGINTASPQSTLDIGSGTAILGAILTTAPGINGNLFTGTTTGITGTTTANYLFPGGAGTDFRVAINGTTASTSTAGRDVADLTLTGSVITEAATSTHPRIGTLFVGSKVVTNGAGATDTLYGAYFQGPATGVTPVSGSWNTIFNRGDVLMKYGKLIVGIGAASAGIGASFISTVTPGSGADAGILATGGTITEFSSGNHTTLAGVYLSAPTITGGAATATKATTLYIDGAPSATVSDRVYSMYVNNGEARFNAAVSKAVAGLSSTTTLDNTWHTVLAEDAGGSYSINLPAAASCTGRVYIIKKVNSSANTITIDADASETIDGATTVALTAQWSTFQIQSNGTNWFVLNP